MISGRVALINTERTTCKGCLSSLLVGDLIVPLKGLRILNHPFIRMNG
jgi:hypothetical protein